MIVLFQILIPALSLWASRCPCVVFALTTLLDSVKSRLGTFAFVDLFQWIIRRCFLFIIRDLTSVCGCSNKFGSIFFVLHCLQLTAMKRDDLKSKRILHVSAEKIGRRSHQKSLILFVFCFSPWKNCFCTKKKIKYSLYFSTSEPANKPGLQVRYIYIYIEFCSENERKRYVKQFWNLLADWKTNFLSMNWKWYQICQPWEKEQKEKQRFQKFVILQLRLFENHKVVISLFVEKKLPLEYIFPSWKKVLDERLSAS